MNPASKTSEADTRPWDVITRAEASRLLIKKKYVDSAKMLLQLCDKKLDNRIDLLNLSCVIAYHIEDSEFQDCLHNFSINEIATIKAAFKSMLSGTSEKKTHFEKYFEHVKYEKIRHEANELAEEKKLVESAKKCIILFEKNRDTASDSKLLADLYCNMLNGGEPLPSWTYNSIWGFNRKDIINFRKSFKNVLESNNLDEVSRKGYERCADHLIFIGSIHGSKRYNDRQKARLLLKSKNDEGSTLTQSDVNNVLVSNIVNKFITVLNHETFDIGNASPSFNRTSTFLTSLKDHKFQTFTIHRKNAQISRSNQNF